MGRNHLSIIIEVAFPGRHLRFHQHANDRSARQHLHGPTTQRKTNLRLTCWAQWCVNRIDAVLGRQEGLGFSRAISVVPSPNALNDLAGAYGGVESDEDDQEQGGHAESDVSSANNTDNRGNVLKRDRDSSEGAADGGNGNRDVDSRTAPREEDRACSKKLKPKEYRPKIGFVVRLCVG